MFRALCVLFVAVLLAGCAGMNQANHLANPFAPASPLSRDVVMRWEKELAAADIAQCRDFESRNALVYRLIFLCDHRFSRYEADLMLGKAARDSFIDLSMFGLTSAAALMTPGSATQILAAIAGGLGFSRNTMEKNFYMNHTAFVLMAKMRALRKEKLNEITAKLRCSSRTYPVEMAIVDVLDYYNRGTMLGALQAISNDTSIQELKAEGAEIRQKSFAPPATAAQISKTEPVVVAEKLPPLSPPSATKEFRARRAALGSLATVMREQGNTEKATEVLKAGGANATGSNPVRKLGDAVDNIGSKPELEKWERAFGVTSTGLVKTAPAVVSGPVEELNPEPARTTHPTKILKTAPPVIEGNVESLNQ